MDELEVLTIQSENEKNVSPDIVDIEASESVCIEKNISPDKVDNVALESAHVSPSIKNYLVVDDKTEDSAGIDVKNDKTLKGKVKKRKKRKRMTKQGDNNEVVMVMKSNSLEKMVDDSGMASHDKVNNEALELEHIGMNASLDKINGGALEFENIEKNVSPDKVDSETLESAHENLSVKDPVAVDGKTEELAGVDVKNDETVKEKVKKPRKKRKLTKQGGNNVVVKVMNSNSSEKMVNSSEKMVDGSGMIFMCNSKTKKDCYRYKVLGSPEGKKNVVSKISKGMQLFLFDFDLKLLYGIYKATSEGGVNIVPKAFNSAYPSQVRFTVQEDCLPLAEENFKAAIKENYFRGGRFDCQLTPEQVKKLCMLFRSSTKGSKSHSLGGSARGGSHRSIKLTESRRFSSGKRGNKKLPARTRVEARDNRERIKLLHRDRVEERAVVQPYPKAPLSYEREAFAPSRHLVRTAPLPPPYAYERPSLPMDVFSGREPSYLDHGPRAHHGLLEPYGHSEPPYGQRFRVGVDPYGPRIQHGQLEPYGHRVGVELGQRAQVGVDPYGLRTQLGGELGDPYGQRVQVGGESGGDPYGQTVQVGVGRGDPYEQRVQVGGERGGVYSQRVQGRVEPYGTYPYGGGVPLEYRHRLSPEPQPRVYYQY